jgi:uncharacterized membrane protein YedE/YeeE
VSFLVEYWPWWFGGFALAVVAAGFRGAIGRPFGISGAFANVLDVSGTREVDRASRAVELDDEFTLALLNATGEEFDELSNVPDLPDATPGPELSVAPRLSWSDNVLFLLCIAAGAAISALLAGDFGALDFGETHARLIGAGPVAWAALFGGGILVGFGTQMASGCTSGHGLSGCGRAQPGSLVATASFFGTGVAVSFLLVWLTS